jgi:hypothetical protein
MQDFEKLGQFYLGRRYDRHDRGKRRGPYRKESQDIGRAKETVEAVQKQLAELDEELRAEIAGVESRFDASSEPLTVFACKPKKSSIAVRLVALVWAPYAVGADGSTIPAW